MKLLGIETSCDETSAAVIEATDVNQPVTLLSNIVASSMSLHSKTGGIIPEIAAREQIKYIIPVINEALEKAQVIKPSPFSPSIDAIAVTYGPGLIGSLLVGVETAKVLSLVWNKPLIAVNHLYGHIYANWIDQKETIDFPILALIVSGGHTDLVLMKSHNDLIWIAGTRDDAAGEAFDKIGRLLHLSYPAGPEIEQLARQGDPKRFSFPRPLLHEPTFDFSFSGLKTAVLREVQSLESIRTARGQEAKYIKSSLPRKNLFALDKQIVYDLARAAQDAIIDVLVKKTMRAAQDYQAKSIMLGGGVAANKTLVENLTQHAIRTIPSAKIFVPKKSLCTDNAAMIATAGFYHQKKISWQYVNVNPELYFETGSTL